MTDTQRRLAAIFFSDMKGFSSQMDADELGTMDRLRRHNAIMSEQIAAHDGRVIKTVGDAFMAEFSSSVAAVACALDCLRSLETHNASTSEADAIKVRIGIHVGDVVVEGDDLFGEAVNVAARLEPQAPVGGVCVSQAVYDQVRRKVHARGEARRGVSLKGIGDEMTLYALWPSTEHLDIKAASGQEPAPSVDGTSEPRGLLVAVTIAALLASAALLYVGVTRDADPIPSAEVESPAEAPEGTTSGTVEAAPGPGPRHGGVLKFGTPTPVFGPFDPYSHIGDMTRDIGDCVFESLVRQDSTGTYQPHTLEGWEFNEATRQITLTLRSDVFFHPHPCLGEGEARAATAQDLAYSVRIAVEHGDLPLPVVGLVQGSRQDTDASGSDAKGKDDKRAETTSPGIEVLGPRVVRVTLTYPVAYLNNTLKGIVLLPAALDGCAPPRKLAQPVGTGPFRLAQITENGRVILKRHEHYWLTDDEGRRLPYLDGIESVTSTDPSDDFERISRSEMQLALVMRDAAKDLLAEATKGRPRIVDSLADSPVEVGLPRFGRDSLVLVLLPLRRSGRMASAAFRQAIAMAIDRSALIEGVHELREPIGRFLKSSSYGYDVSLEPFDRDLDRAKTKLKEAALTRDQKLEPITIAFPVLSELMPRLKEQLETAGIPAKMIPVSLSSAGDLIKDGNVDFLLGWAGFTVAGDEMLGIARMGLSSSKNLFAQDDAFRALATELLATTSREKRRALFRALERKCMELVPYVPLATRNPNLFAGLYFYHPTLEGLFDEATHRMMRHDDWMTHIWLDQKSQGPAAP